MFTGLIEEIGHVVQIRTVGDGLRLKIHCTKILSDLAVDHSVSVNGACLTAVRIDSQFFEADAIKATVTRTNLKYLKSGSPVNLERALRISDRLGGHLVQGHVDDTASILQLQRKPDNFLLTIEIPVRLARYIIPRGSITIDGISLTVADIQQQQVTVAIIPHTLASTTLQFRNPGDRVNVETDLIGKYILRFLESSEQKHEITLDLLHEHGFA